MEFLTWTTYDPEMVPVPGEAFPHIMEVFLKNPAAVTVTITYDNGDSIYFREV